MPLLGSAAMLLSFDVAVEAVADHDHWHTHEHLPERLAIPGFIRGTRWVALRGQPRYLVLYEVEQLDVLTSDAYLQRLNDPSEWTARIMPFYRGMRRGLCTVTGSFGAGLGGAGVLMRFDALHDAAATLRRWLVEEALPSVVVEPGIGSAHLLEGSAAAPMTNEQRIRGVDAGIDWAIFITGYGDEVAKAVERGPVDSALLTQHGAIGVVSATYRLDYALSRDEVGPTGPTT